MHKHNLTDSARSFVYSFKDIKLLQSTKWPQPRITCPTALTLPFYLSIWFEMQYVIHHNIICNGNVISVWFMPFSNSCWIRGNPPHIKPGGMHIVACDWEQHSVLLLLLAPREMTIKGSTHRVPPLSPPPVPGKPTSPTYCPQECWDSNTPASMQDCSRAGNHLPSLRRLVEEQGCGQVYFILMLSQETTNGCTGMSALWAFITDMKGTGAYCTLYCWLQASEWVSKQQMSSSVLLILISQIHWISFSGWEHDTVRCFEVIPTCTLWDGMNFSREVMNAKFSLQSIYISTIFCTLVSQGKLYIIYNLKWTNKQNRCHRKKKKYHQLWEIQVFILLTIFKHNLLDLGVNVAKFWS